MLYWYKNKLLFLIDEILKDEKVLIESEIFLFLTIFLYIFSKKDDSFKNYSKEYF